MSDWRVALTRTRLTHMAMEVAVCATHPLPFEVEFIWPSAVIHKATPEKAGADGNDVSTRQACIPSLTHSLTFTHSHSRTYGSHE